MKIHLRVVEGPDTGRVFEFETRDRFLIGRAPTAHFQITKDPYFSRHHAMLEVDPPSLLLQDLKSRNGTTVNSKKLEGPVRLEHGDTIGGGTTRIQIAIAGAPVAPTDPPGERVPVRCLRCDKRAPHEQLRPVTDSMIYFCVECQTAMLAEPALLADYQIVRELGRGGMGAVYLAVHPRLGRRAIKKILPRAAISQRVHDQFAREAQSQGKLEHPHIVRVYDFVEASPGVFCIIMEYIEGVSAGDLVRATPNGLPVATAVDIVQQALDGLAHAHARGIVHRDIKDDNLLVRTRGDGSREVKLTDFGLAKSYATSGASGFTLANHVSGTAPYMPPEQILQFRFVKPAADLYAMGATLYHLLTRQLAYNFRPQVDPFVTILEEDIVPLRQRRADISPALATVVERALKKEPGARHASADEMRDELLAAAGRR